jgi:hypothetical protein
MRRNALLNAFAIALVVLLSGAGAPAAAQDLTITNVRIIGPDASVVESGSIVVRGGKIVSAGPGRPSTPAGTTIDAKGMRTDYLKSLAEFQEYYRTECLKANIDYVPMDTSVSFDRALMEYLMQRQKRF